MTSCRLFLDAPSAGAWNMAADQVLLERALEGESSLRFYRWSEPTLSLGYFQSYAQRQEHSESLGCPVVRRASGGGAIIHDRELTYSFAAPRDIVSADLMRLYDAFHETLTQTLERFEIDANQYAGHEDNCKPPFLCFQRRSAGDVLVSGHKVAGSAQRRYRSAILQHGSVLIDRSACAPQLPGIRQLGHAHLGFEELVAQWLPPLKERLGLQLNSTTFSDAESCRSEQWVQARFAARQWTLRR